MLIGLLHSRTGALGDLSADNPVLLAEASPKGEYLMPKG
jgi:hypothetical protein